MNTVLFNHAQETLTTSTYFVSIDCQARQLVTLGADCTMGHSEPPMEEITMKRFSIVYQASLRQALEISPIFGTSARVREATRFVNSIHLLCALGELPDEERQHWQNLNQNADKYFDGWHDESQRLQAIARKSTRAHASVSLVPDYRVRVEIQFYSGLANNGKICAEFVGQQNGLFMTWIIPDR